MRPYLIRNEEELPIVSLWFHDDGRIHYVSFKLKGELRTVFNDEYDFRKIIVWKEEE